MHKIVPFFVRADQKAWLGETSCIFSVFKAFIHNALHFECWVCCDDDTVANRNRISIAVQALGALWRVDFKYFWIPSADEAILKVSSSHSS